jgi:hypothetical protein
MLLVFTDSNPNFQILVLGAPIAKTGKCCLILPIINKNIKLNRQDRILSVNKNSRQLARKGGEKNGKNEVMIYRNH